MTAAPVQPAQQPAAGPRPVSGPLLAIRAAAALQASPKAKHVLLAMIGYADFQSWHVWVSTTLLAEDTALSYNSVAAALDELERAGVLQIVSAAKGRRAATYTLSLDSRPSLDPQPLGPNPQGPDRRPPTVGSQRPPVDPQPLGPEPVGSQIEPRRVPTVGTNQTEQRKAAADAGARVSPAAPRPEAPATAAAASTRQGPENPSDATPIALAALPPLSPTNVPTGHVAGLASTAWGQRLLGLLTEAGMLSGDLWTVARRADFDYDLVAYLLHRARECRPKAADGTTESGTAHAARRAGLLRMLSREPREGLAGWQQLQQQRHATRAAALDAVWKWHAAQNGAEVWPKETDAVAAWADRIGLGYTDAKAWARHVPATDLELYPARTGAAGCAKAWTALAAGCQKQIT